MGLSDGQIAVVFSSLLVQHSRNTAFFSNCDTGVTASSYAGPLNDQDSSCFAPEVVLRAPFCEVTQCPYPSSDVLSMYLAYY
jgi:hypothetical protein